jgi:zinc transporter 7
LGDVFLHTIPHAEGQHNVGLWVLLGFGIFLVCDMMIRSLGHTHAHQHNEEDHSHQKSAKKSTVILNLAADALHNFTDGLAIGASFAFETVEDLSVATLLASRGGLATLSILFHEIPHELGDFAILVKNGFSKNQAIMAQFGTAIAAMLGTIVGLFLHDWAGESLLFITAGGFVYLACCQILPEILEERTSWRFRVAQVACFATGIAFLYAVTLLESAGGGHGHSHGHHNHGHPEHQLLEEIPDHHDHDAHAHGHGNNHEL